jgi:hypothetical protein
MLNWCKIADSLIDVFRADNRLSVNYYLSNIAEVLDLISSFW